LGTRYVSRGGREYSRGATSQDVLNGKENKDMSRSIYERRQLRPYTVRWTLRAAVALALFCIVLLAIIGGAAWLIATSDNPLGYCLLTMIAIAVVWVLLQGAPSEDSWRTGVLIWVFTSHDD
jgi:hypothetical protein